MPFTLNCLRMAAFQGRKREIDLWLGLALGVGALLCNVAILFVSSSAHRTLALVSLIMAAVGAIFVSLGLARLVFRKLRNSGSVREKDLSSREKFALWADVFITPRVPWSSLLHSALWHIVALTSLWSMSPNARVLDQSPKLKDLSGYRHLSYYKPPTFPAARSRPPRVRQAVTRGERPFRPVNSPPRQGSPNIEAPSVRLAKAAIPRSVLSKQVIPPVPFSATERNRFSLPAGPSSAIGPLADTSQVALHRRGLPQGGVVPPPPEIGGFAGSRSGNSLATAVVPPPPGVNVSIRPVGGMNIGPSQIVQPAPALPIHEQSLGAGVGQAREANPLAFIVPPPASRVEYDSLSRGRGGSGGGTGTGSQVIPPPVAAEGLPSTRRGDGNSTSNYSQVVPPAVSGQDISNSVAGGRGGGFRNRNSVSSAALSDLAAIPGPPSGGNSAGGPAGSPSGGSTAMSGNSAALGTNSNGAAANAGATSPGSASPGTGSGSPGAGGSSAAMDIPQRTSPLPPEHVDENASGVTRDLPLRLVAMAAVLPTSSYFANYEVFIAERKLGRTESELIKLVYMSLPYQPRLSEYGLNSSRVYNLRVTRDSSCDESLLDMSFPETSGIKSDSSGSKTNALPCYRTTADDYRKALARSRRPQDARHR